MSSSTPVVRQLRVRALRVPMPEPHRTASGIVSESPLVLADLTVDGGAIGRSIVFTYTAAAVKPTADLMANLEPLIVGQPLAPAELTRRLAARRRHRLARRRGPGRRAWAPRLHPPVAGSECAPALGDAHGSLVEYADWWNPILREPLQVIDGMARPASAVGCGMEWDETAVGRFLA
jgi:L-alanine-DL-glutamate epimerase-like enolase superfamily enzyme